MIGRDLADYHQFHPTHLSHRHRIINLPCGQPRDEHHLSGTIAMARDGAGSKTPIPFWEDRKRRWGERRTSSEDYMTKDGAVNGAAVGMLLRVTVTRKKGRRRRWRSGRKL